MKDLIKRSMEDLKKLKEFHNQSIGHLSIDELRFDPDSETKDLLGLITGNTWSLDAIALLNGAGIKPYSDSDLLREEVFEVPDGFFEDDRPEIFTPNCRSSNPRHTKWLTSFEILMCHPNTDNDYIVSYLNNNIEELNEDLIQPYHN